jgi:hypothetical protein
MEYITLSHKLWYDIIIRNGVRGYKIIFAKEQPTSTAKLIPFEDLQHD